MLIIFAITKVEPVSGIDSGTASTILESNSFSISGVLIQVPDTPTETTDSTGSAMVGFNETLGSFDGIVVG